jgi:hypothetical protein
MPYGVSLGFYRHTLVRDSEHHAFTLRQQLVANNFASITTQVWQTQLET